MTEMVERVARALDPKAWKPENMVPTKAITSAMHTRRQSSCISARAAIEAMREPTEVMMDVTGKSTTLNGTEFTFCGEDLVRNGMWQAMIDAALNGNVIVFDPIDRLMKTKGMTFPEAIEHLAEKKGLS